MKTFLIFCAIFGLILFNSCKQLASFDPNVEGARAVANKTLSAPAGMEATHGLKRKITLTWIPVSGASRYEIYCATSATSEFEKIGETDKNFFDDKNVGAGKTFYYKVRAVKSNGTQSPFSVIKKGTSLAKPMISGGNVDENSATIYWFMENSRSFLDGSSNYEDYLKFEVFCEGSGDPKSKTLDAKDFPDSSYKYTFEGLAGSTDYKFYVLAYHSKYQQDTESSPRVNKLTLTSYTPLAPKFSASEGESAEGIWLFITLPEKVMVETETNDSPNEKVDEPFPLCFEIFRKVEGEADNSYVSRGIVYYNGDTTPPAKADYNDPEKRYNAGDNIKWFDDDEDLKGGIKYEYMICSVVDVNYSEIVCPKKYDAKVSTPKDKATKSIGWKSALPDFEVKYNENDDRTLSEDGKTVLSVKLGFEAKWTDLGKAGKYKFAIKQNRRASTDGEEFHGTDTWLKNNGRDFFDSIADVNNAQIKFGSESGLEDDEQGFYYYTLYIVSEDSEIADVESEDKNKVLCSVKAKKEIFVTVDSDLPEANLEVKDGYKDKVILTISSLEEEAKYIVTRTGFKDGKQISSKEFTLDISEAERQKGKDGKFKYKDKVDNSENDGLQPNCEYSYVLKVVRPSGACSLSDPVKAETLGTPELSFDLEKLSYDSITISFNGVLAAKKYTVTLGAGGGFGGGETFDIIKSGDEWNSENVSISSSGNAKAEVKFSANKFTVTIKEPSGYDDATLAGKSAATTVTAYSVIDNKVIDNAQSNSVDVNVLGPALVDAKVNSYDEAKEDSIFLTWKRVEGAKGYLIRRVMYDAEMKNVAEDSDVTYYYDANTEEVTCEDEKIGAKRVEVKENDGKYILTDTYNEADEGKENDQYQVAQSKIAWGLPFRYVVLPVLSKDDFGFESKSLALDSGKVAYANFEEKQTGCVSTWGYGLNLVADKAMSGTTQKIKWDAPNTLEGKQTTIYRRMYTTDGKRNNDFERIRNFSSNDADATITVENDNLCNAYEYIVKYYEKGISPDPNISLPDSLFNEFARQTEELRVTSKGDKIEQKNKGYLLAVDFKTMPHPNPDSKQKYKYAEQISWSPWDYNIRAVGPETMELTMRNYNIDAGEHGVFLITADKTTGKISVDLKTIDGDTDVEEVDFASVYNVTSKSLVNGNATASGMLKVLRDLPHYTLTLKNGEETVSYEQYTHRQITDEELVRAVTLVASLGMKNSKPRSGWSRATDPDGDYTPLSIGSGKVYTKWYTGSFTTKNLHQITYTNFIMDVTTKSGERIPSFLNINGNLNCDVKSWTNDSDPPVKYNGTLTVTSRYLSEPEITLTFNGFEKNSVSTDKKLAMNRNGKTEYYANITALIFDDNGNYGDNFPCDYEEWK